jgi:putative copper export protein/mono/diheme cytochrome c family protein
MQAAEFANATNLSEAVAALPTATLHTRFGHALMLRLAVLPLAVVVVGSGRSRARLAAATVLGAFAVAIEAAIGHVSASGSSLLVASLSFHMLAASAWLGGLIPLLLALAGERPDLAARQFSLLAVIAVATIAATSLQQASVLIGSLPALIGTDYGRMAIVKLALFMALLGLGMMNRFALTPALEAPLAVRRLRASVVIETILGLCVVLTAGQLASLPPGVHLQPDWPLHWRFRFDALTDPALPREVNNAHTALGGALLVAALGAFMRRLRWPVIGVAAVIAVLAAPHLRPLVVAAYPTSFYASPTDFDGYGIAQGAKLFTQHCVACHGVDGRGNGPLARSLDIRPADLTAKHLWTLTDGEMFWYLTHGIDAPGGGLAMPGFDQVLDSDARWMLIDFLRANNAGVTLSERGTWSHPIPAPELEAQCADGGVVTLEDLRGKVVRIVVGSSAPAAPFATIFINPGREGSGACIVSAPEIRLAYAIVAGVTPMALDGTSFMVDPAGWLRTRIRPSDPPPDLDALAMWISATPVGAPAGVGHHH